MEISHKAELESDEVASYEASNRSYVIELKAYKMKADSKVDEVTKGNNEAGQNFVQDTESIKIAEAKGAKQATNMQAKLTIVELDRQKLLKPMSR